MLLLGLHVGGGTRVGGHVHWNNQKYLKVVKTSTNVLHHFALEPLYTNGISSLHHSTYIPCSSIEFSKMKDSLPGND